MASEDYYKTMCCVCSTVLLVIIILISSSFNTVNFDEWALASSAFSKRVFTESDGTAKVYDSGLHGTGLGVEFIRFKKTLHHIDFVNAPGSHGNHQPSEDGTYSEEGSGGNEAEEESGNDSVGSAAARSDGPVTIRSVDGQVVDIEISLQYRLGKEYLFDLYRNYGTDYNSFFLAIVRSTIRDAAAQNPATRFFAERAQLEEDFFNAVDAEFKKRNVGITLKDLQLRGVTLPQKLELTVENIQLSKLEQELKATELTTAQIRANTTLEVKKINAATNLFLTEYNTATDNLRLGKSLLQANVREGTTVIVSAQRENITRDEKLVRAHTANLAEVISGNISVAQSETSKIVANFTYEEKILEKKYDKLILEQRANASAEATIAKATAEGDAAVALAAKYDAAFQDFLSTSSLNAETINLLEWSEYFKSIDGEGMHMDIGAPTKLYLDGQEAALKENLKSKGGPHL